MKLKSKETSEYEDGETNTVVPSQVPGNVQSYRQQNVAPIELGFQGSLLSGDEPEVKDELEEEWICPDCTMINTGNSCVACDLPNPLLFGNVSEEEEEEDLLWPCKFCSVPNEQINNRCIACNKMRQ